MERVSDNQTPPEKLTALLQYLPLDNEGMGYGEITPIPGDAGFRRYFRVAGKPPVLLVDAPPDKEKVVEFIRLAALLKGLGVRTPAIRAADVQRGYLLIEDLGRQSYQDALAKDDAQDLYRPALAVLMQLACCASKPVWLETYSAKLLLAELNLFRDWFVEHLLQYRLSDEEQKRITQVFSLLVNSALAQPQVLVHRDFHCRNLLASADGNPGVIDFQDAVWGPVTYDLVSIARDCYVRWPQSRVADEVARHADALLERGIIDAPQRARFPLWFEYMSAQRHLKVLGIFARLAGRDGKQRYLADLPMVIRYLLETCANVAELKEFGQWFESALIPLASRCPWYTDWRSAGDNVTVWRE